MRFYAWDPAKAASNFRKHGIRFEEAVDAFDDPLALTVADRVEKKGERRWQTLGIVGGAIVLFVAHTEEDEGEDEIVRIISARRATRQERRRYEAALGSGHQR